MRDHPVPCRNASISEVIKARHTTWNEDAICDRCRQAEAVAS
jgi:hypothetical protein